MVDTEDYCQSSALQIGPSLLHLPYGVTVNRLKVKNEKTRRGGEKSLAKRTGKQGLSLEIYEG